MSMTTEPTTDVSDARVVEGSDGLLLEIDGQIVPNYDATFADFEEGEVVSGRVVRIDNDEVLVDIGYKSEGVIPNNELSIRKNVDPHDEVEMGEEVDALALRLLEEARSRIKKDLRRVLLLPPDLTRAHSGAGKITETLYRALAADHCDVHVIPTLGQHVPHTEADNRWMFGSIPNERIHAHDWIGGVKRVGTIPAERMRESTAGVANWEIPVDLNASLMNEAWDLIVNVGHVVPHEVLGFANHNKNYFIGLGGKETICTSHMAAATCGIGSWRPAGRTTSGRSRRARRAGSRPGSSTTGRT